MNANYHDRKQIISNKEKKDIDIKLLSMKLKFVKILALINSLFLRYKQFFQLVISVLHTLFIIFKFRYFYKNPPS